MINKYVDFTIAKGQNLSCHCDTFYHCENRASDSWQSVFLRHCERGNATRGNLIRIASDFRNAQLAIQGDCHDFALQNLAMTKDCKSLATTRDCHAVQKARLAMTIKVIKNYKNQTRSNNDMCI